MDSRARINSLRLDVSMELIGLASEEIPKVLEDVLAVFARAAEAEGAFLCLPSDDGTGVSNLPVLERVSAGQKSPARPDFVKRNSDYLLRAAREEAIRTKCVKFFGGAFRTGARASPGRRDRIAPRSASFTRQHLFGRLVPCHALETYSLVGYGLEGL